MPHCWLPRALWLPSLYSSKQHFFYIKKKGFFVSFFYFIFTSLKFPFELYTLLMTSYIEKKKKKKKKKDEHIETR
jgi:hypothetical protein